MSEALALYDGRTCIGTVTEISGCRFLARDAQRRVIGEYPSCAQAMHALGEWASRSAPIARFRREEKRR